MAEQRFYQRLADAFAAMFRPHNHIRDAREQRPVARSPRKADLPTIQKRNHADRVCESASIEFVVALAAPISRLQQLVRRMGIQPSKVTADFQQRYPLSRKRLVIG